MPDKEGKLTQEEAKTFTDWLEKHWKDRACPISGPTNWIIGTHLVQPLTLVGTGGVAVGGPGYPQAMVICANCGHTLRSHSSREETT